MTQTQLAAVVGVVISLVFTYAPALKDKWAALSASQKQQVMAILIVGVGFVVTGLSCANLIADVPCTKQGVGEFFTGVVVNSVLALATNQATWAITRNLSNDNEDEAVG